MRLGLRVGVGTTVVHDRILRSLKVARIELDETWSFVGKKQRKVTPEDGGGLWVVVTDLLCGSVRRRRDDNARPTILSNSPCPAFDFVIPAKAGTQLWDPERSGASACAGVTPSPECTNCGFRGPRFRGGDAILVER